MYNVTQGVHISIFRSALSSASDVSNGIARQPLGTASFEIGRDVLTRKTPSSKSEK